MTEAKQYLKQAYRLNEMIKSNQEELSSLKELAKSISAIDYSKERVQSSKVTGDANFTNVVEEIVELEKRIGNDIARCIALKSEIRESINQVKDADEKILLRLRYINFKTWDEICNELHVSLRTVHRIHAAALEKFKVPGKVQDNGTS
jgi:DNA-directed RNA polymerase specialized sigma subunit